MPATVNELTLVVRRWDRETGLAEHTQTYPTLDALYAACLDTESAVLIDRVIIRGQDADGQPRTVTFVFQSVTVSAAQ